MFIKRQSSIRKIRIWSNEELKKVADQFSGDVVNVSAWDDRDKEGGNYKDYFVNANQYYYTNYPGDKGYQGMSNEFKLDLTKDISEEMVERFDVVFNHTTLEHVFEVNKAFENLVKMSKDIVIVTVPFAQKQHEGEAWKDYWRFTPTCLRKLYEENGLEVIYEATSPYKNMPIYLFFVGSKQAKKWKEKMPQYKYQEKIGSWIGEKFIDKVLKLFRKSK